MFDPKDKSFDKDALQTPRYIWQWLDSIYNFAMDLCASDDHHLCRPYFTKDQSCLDHNWVEYGYTGFCNPPYSKIDPFLEKAYEQQDRGFTSVFLIPDFNGEERFLNVFENATRIVHLTPRISFIRPDSGKKYSGNNRGSVVLEFAPKIANNQPSFGIQNLKELPGFPKKRAK